MPKNFLFKIARMKIQIFTQNESCKFGKFHKNQQIPQNIVYTHGKYRNFQQKTQHIKKTNHRHINWSSVTAINACTSPNDQRRHSTLNSESTK
jgi:hypothetical protein